MCLQTLYIGGLDYIWSFFLLTFLVFSLLLLMVVEFELFDDNGFIALFESSLTPLTMGSLRALILLLLEDVAVAACTDVDCFRAGFPGWADGRI